MDTIAILTTVGALVAALVSWGVNPAIMRIARPAMYGLAVVAAGSWLLNWLA